MKICILADVQSAHTKRWVRSISNKGHDVILISFRKGNINGVKCHTLKTPKILGVSPSTPLWAKFHYLFARRSAQKIVDEFTPDVVHAFWATSYGFLGARLRTKSFFVSVWGMDITDSTRNFIMRQIVKYTLSSAEKIFCTSQFLLHQTEPLVDNDNLVHIPFGIDTHQFFPVKSEKCDSVVIGSTKSFEPKYGLMNLIRAFEIISNEGGNVELVLVGSGSLKDEAQEYVRVNMIENRVTFYEAVDVDMIPEFLNKMDIYVMPSVSNSETFGVAALEASASGIPVIASRIGGVPEVVDDGVTGLLVEPNDIEALTSALKELVGNSQLRRKMGTAGRLFVQEKYLWDNNVDALLENYTN